ncbi:Cyclin-like F-box [Akanthomyces lecanii RCEF 1005]|uniref:Cyclin-like F-box n=1 Tax=Akanthomyces lecanii RCEF 1005 TaxID=1081108 RepID=A0A168H1V3_CORDF|nr:Cyclin-like F-box [Akanthomyces lecanii RCEF 1005]
MDNLPAEIFAEILGYLPPAACKSARLTSRQFNAILAAPTFSQLRAFLDPDTAMATLCGTLHDLPARPRAMWSPHCSVPEALPLPRSFLRAMYTALGGRQRPWTRATRSRLALADSSSDESGLEESETELQPADGEEEEDGDMSAAVMLQRLGRPEVSEQMLRQALFRYALYKSYVYDGEGEAPQLWVMNSTKWKYQL